MTKVNMGEFIRGAHEERASMIDYVRWLVPRLRLEGKKQAADEMETLIATFETAGHVARRCKGEEE